jgi:hypothetical protein
MVNDDTAPGLTPEEIADRRRLAAELMWPGSLADQPPNFLAQRDQQLMARLLLDPRPMASAADLNAPALPMPSGPSSAPDAPDSTGRLLFDPTPMLPPAGRGAGPGSSGVSRAPMPSVPGSTPYPPDSLERPVAGGAPILPPGLSRIPPANGPGAPANVPLPRPRPRELAMPQGRDMELTVRTILGEAEGEGEVGQLAVANAIRNRVLNGNFGGRTVEGVIRQPGAFEAWADPVRRRRMEELDPNSAQFQRYRRLVERAYAGEDPTGGATHFYSPGGQRQRGRRPPSWSVGRPYREIGRHRFYQLER